MKTINRMVLLLATLFAAIGCSDDDKELVMYSLRFESNSITLGIGKSYRLVPISDPLYDDVQYEWKSVDERVATVDQSGVVTGVSAGSTEVRAFYGWRGAWFRWWRAPRRCPIRRRPCRRGCRSR